MNQKFYANINNKKKITHSWALVAHAYNPSYSGGRDKEDHSLKPALANSSQDPSQKGLVERLKV
jgi:hypothetical protein